MDSVGNPDRISDEAPDDKLVALGRAIAYELIQLGYRPAPEPGLVAREGHPWRVVALDIWKAMKEILAGQAP